MGCASSRNLQVVTHSDPPANPNPVPAESNNVTNGPPAKTGDTSVKASAPTTKRQYKVRKHSGPIESFTILWSELPSKPELSLDQVCEIKPADSMECWDCVRATSTPESSIVIPALKRRGWKTIRLFVSSTFKDFHAEREVLVKQASQD